MGIVLTAILAILAITIVIGIIRVIITPSDSFGDLICDILLIDLLGDLIVAILDAFSN